MTVTPEVRRANRWLLLCLIVFSIALALTVFLWMRRKIRENGGVVNPQYSMRLDGTDFNRQVARVYSLAGRAWPALLLSTTK
jgi:hypothetical protein